MRPFFKHERYRVNIIV